MKAIKLAFGTRYARYTDGALEVGLAWELAEKGCFYEYEIAGAMMGLAGGRATQRGLRRAWAETTQVEVSRFRRYTSPFILLVSAKQRR